VNRGQYLPAQRGNEEIMKTKVMAVVSMLVFALAMMAQTATPTAPAAAGDAAKTCACCNQADAKTGEKMDCCGKDGGCCKDGKCDMKAHKDGKMACCSGDKCPMTAQKDGKVLWRQMPHDEGREVVGRAVRRPPASRTFGAAGRRLGSLAAATGENKAA
jgi:hypothetical protein